MRHALNLAPFGALSEPGVLVELGLAAEEHGWDGLFLWDHIHWPHGPTEVADVWTVLSAVAATTQRLRMGPMVTPLPRRRVQVLAKQTVTLDRLSGGRLTLGLGAGSDRHRELSGFGEPTGARELAARLDEGIELLEALWRGEPVDFHGDHFVADGVALSPGSLQQPRIPVWIGIVGSHAPGARRAARADGVFPIDVDEDQLARLLDAIAAHRGTLDGFDVAVAVFPGVDAGALERRGATWLLHSFGPDARPDQVLRRLARGPT